MNAMKATGLTALVVTAMLGCAGLTTQQKMPEHQQEALFRDIQDQPAAYRAYQCPGLVIVEPISEKKSIEVVGQGCREIEPLAAPLSNKSQKTRTFRSLVGKNNERYAYAQWNYRAVRVGARELDETTLRVWYHRVEHGGP